MIKAIGFDLDGTLLDTLADLADATNHVLAERGHPIHPISAYKHFVGNGVDMLIKRALPESAADQREDAKASFFQVYGQSWNKKTVPYPGIVELLDALIKKNVYLVVLSNKPDMLTKLAVSHYFDQHEAFKNVRGAHEGIPIKPDPDALTDLVTESRLDKSEWLFVGDTRTDILTARAAGVTSVGVLWGFRSEDELRGAGATHIISEPAQLLDLLDDKLLDGDLLDGGSPKP
jgi:phosphoglycolate phosphatase